VKVYIAAPYPERAAAQQVMRRLNEEGIEVTSTWLVQEDKLEDQYARLDLADVARADVLVALNLPGYENAGTGGRHIEFGYALALGKPIVLVGARSNIFHYLDDVAVCDEAELIGELQAIADSRIAALTPEAAIARVVAELRRAETKHKPFNSFHEGYAVILEEVEELWDDVKADRHNAALAEAVQVSAMGLRFVVNLSGRQRPSAAKLAPVDA
jgi:nucleoside 2-deoxyribosyltransferase